MSDHQAFYAFMYTIHHNSHDDISLASALSLWTDVKHIFECANARIKDSESKLDNVARTSPQIIVFMKDNQRMKAVKELRDLTHYGIKEAKESIDRVYGSV